MSALFSPITLRHASLPNRIIVSPMCQYSAEDGLANKWHEVHLATLGLSGAAMLCIESTAVEPQGRITPGDLGLWNDATEAALKTVLDTVRAHSDIFITLQLAHAGRKAGCVAIRSSRQKILICQGFLMKSVNRTERQLFA